MALLPADIVNRAIQLYGDNQSPVTGVPPNFDGTPTGKAAGVLYAGVVQTVSRQYEWDFARRTATLVLSGNTAPPQWAYEYLYPTNGIEINQLMPTTITDPNNPLPVSWTVGNATVSSNITKVIWTNLQNAIGTFTNQPPESTWDAGFTETVVRLLASELAMGIAGRPDTSAKLLESAQAFEQSATTRDG